MKKGIDIMNFAKIAWRDISKIFKNRIIRISVVAIIIVPLLYSLLYLAAFWDPYSNLQNMHIAVVNEDKGTEYDGKLVSYGNDIIDNLKSNKEVGWTFVTKSDAEEGLKGKKYYAMFVIPNNFSQKILSAKNGEPEKAEIMYTSNDKKNFIASQIDGKIELILKEEVTQNITDEYTKVAFDNLYDVKDGLNQAADGSGKLNDGIDKVKDGSIQLKDGLGVLNNNASKISDGVNKLYIGSKELANGIDTLAVDENNKPLGLRNGATQLVNGIQGAIPGAFMLNQGADKLNLGVTELGKGTAKLNAAVNTGISGQMGLSTGILALNNAVNGSEVKMADGTILPGLKIGISSLYNGVMSSDPSSGLVAGVSALDNSVNGTQTKLPDGTIVPGLKNGMSMLVQGVGELKGGVVSLNNAVNGVAVTMPDKTTAYINPENGNNPSLVYGIGMFSNSISNGYQDPKYDIKSIGTDPQKLNDALSHVGLAQALKIADEYTQAGHPEICAQIIHTMMQSGAADKLVASANGLNSGARQLGAGVESLSTKVNNEMVPKVTLMKTGTEVLGLGVSKLNYSVQNQLAPGVQQLNTGVNGNGGLSSSVELLNNAVNVGMLGQPSLSSGIADLNSAVNTGINGEPSLAAGMLQLKSGTLQLIPGLQSAADGASGILDGANKLSVGANQLSGGISTLNSNTPELVDGVNKLYNGSTELNDGINKLADGSKELSTKLVDGSNKINKELINSSKVMGKFVSEPILMKEIPLNPIKNYGTGFTPYFIPLSLWVGALMMFFIITDKVDSDIEAGPFAIVVGKFLSYGYIGVIQALLVSAVVLTLGLKPQSIVLFFLFNVFMSYVFIAIIQCLVFLLGQAGRLLSIVLLILQLTACAGTFPIEVVPNFFKILNPIMPFTYCVSALREIISGIDYTELTQNVLVLAGMMVVFLMISIIMKNRADKVQTLLERRREKMEYQAKKIA